MKSETLKSKEILESKPIKISGSEAVVRSLIAEGVDVLYGYPGGAIMPVYDALYKYQDQINHVLTRHEQGATHAAQGFWKGRCSNGYFWTRCNEFNYRNCGCSN